MVRQAADVVRKLEKLSEADQTLVARYLDSHFEEIVDEARWQGSFARSSDLLKCMSDEVDAAINCGDTAPLKPDDL